MPEIQALRTLAVGFVVAFHLSPAAGLTGGFVGVDVFFVISGYLITNHLMRTVNKTGTVSLPSFYARRIRRLLPASLLVLVLTFIASMFLLPNRFRLTTAREVVASTFYVENLWLASKAVTYSASNDLASPVQHYWSLSTEEQFYFIWPALILLGLWLGRRFFKGHTRRAVAGVLVVLATASFVHSVVFTAADPSMAYFITTTRVWEFAIGGLTSFFLMKWAPKLPTAIALRWVGVALIVFTGFWLKQSDPFPGAVALLPTLGTSAVIVAGDTSQRDPLTWLFDLRPVQWLGDISYSIYLWHWPLIVLTPYVVGSQLNWFHKLIVVALTLLLSDATRRWIEKPAIASQWLSKTNGRTFLAMLAAMALIAGSSLGYQRWSTAHDAKRAEEIRSRIGQDPCVGAKGTANPQLCPGVFTDKPLISVTEADAPWGLNCTGEDVVRNCWEGERPKKVLALIGDSHAESLYWAVAPIAEKNDWGIQIYFEGGCPASLEPSNRFEGEARWGGRCVEFTKKVTESLHNDPPDLIVATAYTGSEFEFEDKAIAGFHELWRDWTQFSDVVVVRDYPTTGGRMMPECLAQNPNDQLACASPRDSVLKEDVQFVAAQQYPDNHVRAIDLSDAYCDVDRCYPVVGGLPVYFDHDHISRPFAQSLSPQMREHIELR